MLHAVRENRGGFCKQTLPPFQKKPMLKSMLEVQSTSNPRQLPITRSAAGTTAEKETPP